jgi:hypothetical protein
MAKALEANSQVIQTARGPVEYTIQGSGPTVRLQSKYPINTLFGA